MKITSPAFAMNLPVPVPYTCNGANVSPPFEFLDVPEGTASFVLVVEDMDSSNNWIHWLVYNIPGNTTHFDEGKIPEGAVNGFCNAGTQGYEGPCPKQFSGIRHFAFRLFAIDKMLDVNANADHKLILGNIHSHIIETAELIAVAEGELVSQNTQNT